MTEKEISEAIKNIEKELESAIKHKVRSGCVFNFLDLYPLAYIENNDDWSDVEHVAVTAIWSDPLGLLDESGRKEPGMYAEYHAMTNNGPAKDEMKLIPIDMLLIEDKKWILDQINEVIAVYGEEAPYKTY